MISATSSVTSGLLSSAFGTPAPSPYTIPNGTSSSNASLVESLLPSSPDGGFLSNLIFGQDTEALLNDPFSNGAITGTPSSYVEQIIQKLAPGAPSAQSTNSTQNAATTTSPAASTDPTTTSLPPEGILA